MTSLPAGSVARHGGPGALRRNLPGSALESRRHRPCPPGSARLFFFRFFALHGRAVNEAALGGFFLFVFLALEGGTGNKASLGGVLVSIALDDAGPRREPSAPSRARRGRTWRARR